MQKIKCPCCDNFTIESEDEMIVEICDVCFWQFDEVAHDNPNISIGANCVSLIQARNNYKKFGACDLKYKNRVRKPLESELPQNHKEI